MYSKFARILRFNLAIACTLSDQVIFTMDLSSSQSLHACMDYQKNFDQSSNFSQLKDSTQQSLANKELKHNTQLTGLQQFAKDYLNEDQKKLLAFTAQEAQESFKKQQLEDFDALVGDTACEIRALFVFLKSKTQTTLTDKDLLFLTLSKLLTKAKKLSFGPNNLVIKETISPQLLGSQRGGDYFKKKAQAKLAELSIDYLHELANNLTDSELKIALSFVKIDNIMFNRPSCACYPSVKAILQTLLNNNHPIIIKIVRFCADADCKKRYTLTFVCVPNNQKTDFEITNIPVTGPIFLIEGYSISDMNYEKEIKQIDYQIGSDYCTSTQQFIQQFKNQSIMKMLLGFCAMHTQFNGDHRITEIPFDELNIPQLKQEFLQAKLFAQKVGCYDKDFTMLKIDHIYATNMEKLINKY